jgi:hypothetical protein
MGHYRSASRRKSLVKFATVVSRVNLRRRRVAYVSASVVAACRFRDARPVICRPEDELSTAVTFFL